MRILRSFDSLEPEEKGASIAIGNFDGMHKGHQAVLARMSHYAEEHSAPRAVMTFEPHPRRFFRPQSPTQRIFPLHHKLRLFKAIGIDIVYLVHFDRDFSSQSAEGFMEHLLHEQLDAKAVVTGFDFCFGKARSGNADMLEQYAKQSEAFAYDAVAAQTYGETIYSSTTIRTYLAEGKVKDAAALLGRPYSIMGRIVKGNQLGRDLGYPTANVALPHILIPRYGVYAARAVLDSGVVHKAIANIGIRPSVGGANVTLEVHLFDVTADLYGQRMEVALVDFIRDEQTFDGLDALKAQIAIDCEKALAILEGA